MRSVFHQQADLGESLEVFLFSGEQWIAVEVWDDLMQKVTETPHLILECFIRIISSHETAPEVLLHEVEDFGAILVLTYRETWFGFPPNQEFLALRERNTEASFTVNISRYVIVQISLSVERRHVISRLYHELSQSPLYGGDISRYGVNPSLTLRTTSHGIALRSSLHPWIWSSREGFTVISRICMQDRSRIGQLPYPTRYFARAYFAHRCASPNSIFSAAWRQSLTFGF